jgi:HK97 family phage prohead protease
MNKQINSYAVKSFGTELKDLSLDNREVAVYLSVFDTIDSDNDIIRRGAFKKSINDKGPDSSSNRKIAFLRHHDWEQQIGKFLRLEEDSKGLFAVGKLGTSTKGEDALRDYEEGIINEHSIGFQYMTVKKKIP